jgi:hypothetical protein
MDRDPAFRASGRGAFEAYQRDLREVLREKRAIDS